MLMMRAVSTAQMAMMNEACHTCFSSNHRRTLAPRTQAESVAVMQNCAQLLEIDILWLCRVAQLLHHLSHSITDRITVERTIVHPTCQSACRMASQQPAPDFSCAVLGVATCFRPVGVTGGRSQTREQNKSRATCGSANLGACSAPSCPPTPGEPP